MQPKSNCIYDVFGVNSKEKEGHKPEPQRTLFWKPEKKEQASLTEEGQSKRSENRNFYLNMVKFSRCSCHYSLPNCH